MRRREFLENSLREDIRKTDGFRETEIDEDIFVDKTFDLLDLLEELGCPDTEIQRAVDNMFSLFMETISEFRVKCPGGEVRIARKRGGVEITRI